MNPLRKLVLAASFLIFSQASMAAFVARDLHVVGDGLLTFDSVTNLEWLDVTASVGRSYNDVATQLGGGGDFAGFHYATLGEMEKLYQDAGITPGDGTFLNDGQAPQIQQFVSFFGGTWFEAGGFPGPGVRGIYGQADGSDARFMADAGINLINNSTASFIGGQGLMEGLSFADGQTNPAIGSFLVRSATSVVPIPATGWLLLTGFAALSGSTRRRPARV